MHVMPLIKTSTDVQVRHKASDQAHVSGSAHMPCSAAGVSSQTTVSAAMWMAMLLAGQLSLSAPPSVSRRCKVLVAKRKLREPAPA